jgi:hypothetical protein
VNVLLQQIRKKALMLRGKMDDYNENEATIGRDILKELLNCGQASGRGSNAYDRWLFIWSGI